MKPSSNYWLSVPLLAFFTTVLLDDNKIANRQFLNKQMHCREAHVGRITAETLLHFLRLPKLKMTVPQSKLFKRILPVEATYPHRRSTINLIFKIYSIHIIYIWNIYIYKYVFHVYLLLSFITKLGASTLEALFTSLIKCSIPTLRSWV